MQELGVPQERAGREAYVRAMFDGIAPRYDLLNRILSFGQDVRWRRACARAIGPGARRILDVGAGTGDLGLELLRCLGPSGRVVAVDFAWNMLGIGRRKARSAGVAGRLRPVVANALALPFPDGSFDAATMAFAARNVADLVACFAEMGRVVRPGGLVVCLELSHPVWAGWRQLYRWYLYHVVPLVGRLVVGRRGPYDYLPRSLTGFPSQEGLARIMAQAGLSSVRYRNLLGGIAAIHVGQVAAGVDRPPSPGGEASLRGKAWGTAGGSDRPG